MKIISKIKVVFCFSPVTVLTRFINVVLGKFYLTIFVNVLTYGFSSVQFSRSVVSDSATPWIAARQASLSITNSWSLPKLMSIESVMPSNHLILCHPLLQPSIFPNIRVFSNELALCIRWPKYWSFSFNISPTNEYPGLISFRMDWLDLLAVQGTLKSLLPQHSSKASVFPALSMRHRTQPAATPSHTDFQSAPVNFLHPWFLSFGSESSRPHEIEMFSFSENGT